MKKHLIFLSLMLIVSTKGFSQITLEKSYKSATNDNDFYLDLFNTGDEIVIGYYTITKSHDDKDIPQLTTATTLSQITLYNLNHSIRNTISLSAYSDYFVKPILANQKLFPISKKLFNDDNKIELLIEITNKASQVFMVLINEDGKELQRVALAGAGHGYSLYNLGYAQGTKLRVEAIVADMTNRNDEYLIFQLAGTIPSPIASNGRFPADNTGMLGNFFPNPAQNSTQIYYELPTNKDAGTFNIYNMEGQLLKELKVDKGFTYLELNTSELPSGSYIGQLICEGEIIGAKKLIVVK